MLPKIDLPPNRRRYFISETFDPTNKNEVQTTLNKLLSSPPKDFKSAAEWFGVFSETSSAVAQVQTLLELQVQRNTADKQAEVELQRFDENIVSQMLSARAELIDIYLSSPWRVAMHADDNGRIVQDFLNRRKYTAPQLVELQLTENQLVRKYRQFMSQATATFRGRTQQLSVVVGKLNDNAPDVRKDAFFSYWQFVQERHDELQGLFQALLENRTEQAHTLGEKSYVPIAFAELGRIDYTIDDCTRFRDAIVDEVVPVISELSKYQALNLKTRMVKPWDLNAWPQLMPTQMPANGNLQAMLSGMKKILAEIHPSFVSLFSEMQERNLIDIEPRPHKSAGAFCVTFQDSGLPFIFGNFAGTQRDGMTLIHEFGHAIHGYATSSIANPLLRHPGLEFCEFASLGLEVLAAPHLHHWWENKSEAKKAWAIHAFNALQFWPFMAMIDEFQHQIYSAPQMSFAERNRVWCALSKKYRPHADWTDCEELECLGWFSRQHIFTSPFYYIDYGIAQVGALQLWQNSKLNRTRATEHYIDALSLGAQRSLPELFKAAGCTFDLSRPSLAGLAHDLKREVQESIFTQ